jgi:hypothetical protein
MKNNNMLFTSIACYRPLLTMDILISLFAASSANVLPNNQKDPDSISVKKLMLCLSRQYVR